MQPKFLISGGGTGGHIFPAIAIADALKARYPDAHFLFVGALGRMEMEKVPEAGYPIEGLWISGLQRKLTLKNLSFPFKLLSSMLKAHKIIRDFKPDVVIGTGGYASGPVLRAATSNHIPTLILEQNSYPGITTKILAPKVNRICVAYEGMDKWLPISKIVTTGNPVRKEIQKLAEGADLKAKAIQHFSLSAEKKTILVIGGSLGARTINLSIEKGLKNIADAGHQLLWQTGKLFFSQAKTDVETLNNPSIKAFAFIKEMDLAYSLADVVISRAGAIAISELCIAGKPSILVPSPNVAEDHQTKNAKALADKQAALMIRDVDAGQSLVDTALELIHNTSRLQMLSGNILKLAKPSAITEIANEITNLIPNKG